MYAPTKSDWKKFREKLPGWQESYMEKLVKEYAEYLTGEEPASTKFWTMEKRIKADKRTPGVLLSLNKSNMDWDIARLIKDGAIGMEDLEDFSGELKEEVQRILGWVDD